MKKMFPAISHQPLATITFDDRIPSTKVQTEGNNWNDFYSLYAHIICIIIGRVYELSDMNGANSNTKKGNANGIL